MTAKKIAKVLASICLGTFFMLATLELGLRAVKVVSPSGSSQIEVPPPPDWERAVRIVVLGESTSAPRDRGGRDGAWPARLEEFLNTRFGKRSDARTFRVVNLARAASSSPFEVALLEKEASKLQPDILISMLGVNDATVHAIEGDFFYENFYLVRFSYWAQVAWACPKCHDLNLGEGDADRVTVSKEEQADANAAIRELDRFQFQTRAEIEEFERWRLEQVRIAGHEQHYVNAVLAEQLFSISQHPSRKGKDVERMLLIEGKTILNRSYKEMVLKRSMSLQHYCHYRTILHESGCVEAFKEAIQDGMTPTPQLMTIAAPTGSTDDEFLRLVYRGAGFKVSNAQIGGQIVAQSYRRLEAIVRDHHIVWMPMQYPRGSVGALEFYMNDEALRAPREFHESFEIPAGTFQPRLKGAILISNENFNTIVTAEKEAEYFTDFFARDHGLNFGHTTFKGYDLIANNAADQIEKSWPEIEPRLRARKGDARP